MLIGIPKEITNEENRVSLTPTLVSKLIDMGHEVYIQQSAGKAAGFQDHDTQKL